MFVSQLSNVWEQVISPPNQTDKILPYRLVFLFDDNICVYPAQRIDQLKVHPRLNALNYLPSMRNSDKDLFISRKVKDFQSSSTNVTTFWTPLKTPDEGLLYGAIGLQSDLNRNLNCLSDLETSFAAPSYIMVLD
jgi:hypothetical protein